MRHPLGKLSGESNRDALWDGARAGRFSRLEHRADLWQVLVLIASRKAMNLRRRSVGSPVQGESAVGSLAEVAEAIDFIVDGDPGEDFVGELSVTSNELVGALPPQLATVARLKLQGFTNQEIAEKLARVERTVERYVSMIRHHWQSGSTDSIR